MMPWTHSQLLFMVRQPADGASAVSHIQLDMPLFKRLFELPWLLWGSLYALDVKVLIHAEATAACLGMLA